VQWARRATCPWVLRLFDGDAPDDLWRFPSILPLLRKAAARPALVRGLRRARGAWRELALIHGDLKHDNLLRDGAGHYALIDWEMARIGDPAWDLAGLLLRPLLSPHVQGFDDGARRAALALLRSYSHAGEASKPALAQRLVLYCGAWLVMSLLQSESVAANEAQACDKLLATAERCFAQADSWAASLAEDDKEQAHAA
jgi:thiamine kinase-like enzyme